MTMQDGQSNNKTVSATQNIMANAAHKIPKLEYAFLLLFLAYFPY
jgi:hypothetical protein